MGSGKKTIALLAGLALGVWTAGAHATVLIEADFEDLNTGNLAGQAGGTNLSGTWSVTGSSSPQVISGGLSYNVVGGGTIDGGSQAVQSPGSGDWINRDFDGDVSLATTVYRRYLFSATGSVGDNEVFSRANGWTTYSALKHNGDTLENRIGDGDNTGQAVSPLATDTVYLVVDRLTYDAGSGNWTAIDTWINPAYGDEGSPDRTRSDGAESPSNYTMFDLRLQNDTGVIDELVIADSWDDVVPAPEPGSFAIAAIGIGFLASRRKRDRR